MRSQIFSNIFIGFALVVSQDPQKFRWIIWAIESLQMLLHCILKTLHLPINTIFTTNGIITSVACSRTDYTGNYIIKISWLVLRLLKGLIVNQNFEIQILRYQWVLSLPLQKAWFNNVPRFDFNNVTINLIPCQTFSLDTFNSIEVVTTYSQIKFNTSVNTREIRPEWSPFKFAFSFRYPWWLRLILRVKKKIKEKKNNQVYLRNTIPQTDRTTWKN